MINYFSKYNFIFYLSNFILVSLYLFPGSLLGCYLYDDCKLQPQITPDFIISSNHFYVFVLVSLIGFLTFLNIRLVKILTVYLILLSIILECLHLIIPGRTFQWADLFGNLVGVIVVILFKNLINKYGVFKK